MSKPTNLVVICAAILAIHAIAISFPAVAAAPTVADHRLSWFPATTSTLTGLDLDIDDMELLMDTETNRRILATSRRYISYGALSKNNVPCSRRGASYYNCRSGGQANPYTRGCSTITRCRR